MNESTYKLILLIGTIIIFCLVILTIAWVNSPDVVFTFRIEMDNNTLTAFEHINYSSGGLL